MTYVTLAVLKEALGITGSARDDLLNRAIDAAVLAIDNRCGRTFTLAGTASARTYRTARRVSPQRDGDELLLVDDIAATDGLIVEAGSGSTWSTLAATAYETWPENALVRGRAIEGLMRASWAGARQVRVTAKWGWPAVPDDISQAAQIQATRLYRRKDSPEGVAGSSEWGAIRLARLDPDVHSMTQPYVLPGFG